MEPSSSERRSTSPLTETVDGDGVRDPSGSTGTSDRTSVSVGSSDPAAVRTCAEKVKAPFRVFAEGENVHHFQLVRKLGAGAFGQVWLADDTRLHRQVAIKLPHRSFVSESTEARRFYREAETAAKLTHPNLVPILDAVLQDDLSYIVSEYCPGPTLRRWLDEQKDLPSPRTAVSIIAQLASGLNVAHQLGLIHRDIKPSNILLANADTDHPIPRLTDFGLARAISDVSETRTGALVGSGRYMSPEQASGNIDDHGPHSDVHALGVLLYELLTLQSPFASDNEMDTLHRIISLDPPSIHDVRQGVSRDISAVCQRCLEKSPTRRYQDAGELFADLQRVLDGRPPVARPVGRFGRITRWASRNKTVASLASLTILSCLAAILGLVAYAFESARNAEENRSQAMKLQRALGIAQEQRSDAITQKAEAIKQRNSALQNYKRWQRSSYTSDLSFAFLRFHQSYLGDVRRLLNRQVPKSDEDDLRTVELWVLDQQLRQSYEVWDSQDQGFSDCRLINDDTLLTVGANGDVVFWDTATATPQRRLIDVSDQLTSVAVLGDDRLVVPGVESPSLGRSVHIIDSNTGKVQEVLHSHPTTIDAIEVSDLGDVLASSSRYESIRCWFPQEKRSVDISNRLRNESFAMTPDGRRITTSQRDQQILQVFDTRSGDVVQQCDIGVYVLRTAGANQNLWAGYVAALKTGFGLAHVDNLGDHVWIDSQSVSQVMKFSQNDNYLAVSDRRGDLELFELITDDSDDAAGETSRLPEIRSVSRLAGLLGTVNDLEVSQNGDIYAISKDGKIERFSPLQENHFNDIQTLPHSRDSIVTADGRVTWSVEHNGIVTTSKIAKTSSDTGVRTQSERVTSISNAGAICISDEQKRLAVLNRDHMLDIYENQIDSEGFQPDFSKKRRFDIRPIDKSGTNQKVKFSRTGRYVAATADDNGIAIFDLQSAESDPVCFRNYENNQRCFQFSPDGELFVCAGFGGVEAVELSTGRTRFFNRPSTNVKCIAFHPDGDSILVGNIDGSIHCLDTQSGQAISQLHGFDSNGQHTTLIRDIAFISDDRIAVMTHSRELQFWDLNQQVQLGSLFIDDNERYEARFCHVQWLPDVQQLIVLIERDADTKVIRWSIPDQKPCSRFTVNANQNEAETQNGHRIGTK